MCQLRAPEVGVDQRRDHPELGQPEPCEYVLWSCLHEEGYDFSILEALAFEVKGDAVAQLIAL